MNPELLKLEEQKKAVRRARAQGRQWILRGILLGATGVAAVTRGGSFYHSLALALAIVAVLAAHLGLQMRRTAAEMERKINLMASADAQVLPKPQDLEPKT